MTARSFMLVVARRLVGAAAVVVAVTAAAWVLLHATRPNLFAADAQLLDYLRGVFLHFDFGRSTAVGRPDVADTVRKGLPVDVVLLGGGLALGLLGGLGGGAWAAARGRGTSAWAMQAAAMLALCAPVYVVGLSLLLLFGADIGALAPDVIPLRYVPYADSHVRWLGSMIMPWVVIALPIAGLLLRSMYGETREALQEEPVRTARAKGVPERVVLVRHAAPLGAGPAISLAGASANFMLLNIAITERVFNIPGVFNGLPQAVGRADVAMILALTLCGAVLVSLTTLVSDLLLYLLDPRIR